jgi:hypothetical protein
MIHREAMTLTTVERIAVQAIEPSRRLGRAYLAKKSIDLTAQLLGLCTQ